MKRKALIVAAPLLALLSALLIRRLLRTRQSTGLSAEVANPAPEVVQAAKDESDSPSSRELRAPEVAAAAPPSTSVDLRPIGEAVEMSYASTLAAFALHAEEADYETLDAKAQQDADQLQRLFSSMRVDLAPELSSACEAIIDRIAAAQLQLMAFAINRKNRGLPDSAQAEAELADRKAFETDAEPLFARVKAALGTAGVGA